MLIGQVIKPVHFKFKDSTGVNALIAITTATDPNVNNVALEVGDEIGVFNTKDTCCGAVVWEKANTAIRAQGDNTMTPSVDGFIDGELMAFKIWVKKSNKEYKAKVQYSAVDPYRTGSFYINGIYLLLSLSGYTPVKVGENIIPDYIKVHQNYPNPFNPSTKINISIPERCHVTFEVIDINGNVIKTLNNSFLESGDHLFEWDGKNSKNKKVSSGVYFYKTIIGEKLFFGKMLLSK
jgi:hypothetical protein